jgi:hypothetical protein
VTITDAMFIHVFVRRADVVGSAPFTWEIRGAGTTPIQVSVKRFKSMYAAHEAGQARLAELKPPPSTPRLGRSAVRPARYDAKDEDQILAA